MSEGPTPGRARSSHPGRPRRADLHVHTEWSWDADHGSMEACCRRAQRSGLRVLAFTEHADYTAIADGARLDLEGYLECLARCRRQFPDLALRSGVELGEPHRFPAEAARLLAAAPLDLVLGSVHCVEVGGSLVDLSLLEETAELSAAGAMAAYLAEVLALLRGPIPFQVLTHLEYPKRYWPIRWPRYRSADHREGIAAVLEAARAAGVILELNTSGGMDPRRGLCPGAEVLGWWRDAGGREVSIGSDAHRPERVASGFAAAAAALAAAGFSESRARPGLWTVSSTFGSGRRSQLPTPGTAAP